PREREGCEAVDGLSLHHLVAARLRGALVEVVVATEPRARSVVDAPHELLEVGLLRRRRRGEAHAVALLHEDAVDGGGVKMNIQIQTTAKSLRKRDGSGLGAAHPGETFRR